MDNNVIRVANDSSLQNTFKEDYERFVEDFILFNNLVLDTKKTSLEANRKEILHMVDSNIVRLREIYNLVNNLDMLDMNVDMELEEALDIEIPFIFNCVGCGIELKQGDDFNFCNHCLEDYTIEQERAFTN